MQLIFARSRHPISLLIQILSQFKWSHVGIVDGDHVIEAKGGVGVVRTPIEDFKKHYTETEIRYLDGDIKKARALVGLPYDMRGVWGLLFRLPIEDPSAWFCSEIIAHAAHRIGDEYEHKFNPKVIHWISSTKE